MYITMHKSYDDEIWKRIPGFQFYDISNYGRIRSIHVKNSKDEDVIDGNWRLIKARLKKYVQEYEVTLKKTTKYIHCTVHIMVLEAFVGPRPFGYEAKFIDGNKRNYILSNLKWAPKKDAKKVKESQRILIKRDPKYRLKGKILAQTYSKRINERDVHNIKFLLKYGGLSNEFIAQMTSKDVSQIIKIRERFEKGLI